jgi:hypothetical protein
MLGLFLTLGEEATFYLSIAAVYAQKEGWSCLPLTSLLFRNNWCALADCAFPWWLWGRRNCEGGILHEARIAVAGVPSTLRLQCRCTYQFHSRVTHHIQVGNTSLGPLSLLLQCFAGY